MKFAHHLYIKIILSQFDVKFYHGNEINKITFSFHLFVNKKVVRGEICFRDAT